MCDPVAGGGAHLHVEAATEAANEAATEAVNKAATEASNSTHDHSQTAAHNAQNVAQQAAGSGNASATDTGTVQGMNWLEEASKIKPPAADASESQWMDYAEKVAKVAGLPQGMVKALIESKGAANATGSHAADDGTGEQVYGPLSVHGGLLKGGIYSNTSHALKDANGQSITAEDIVNDPAKAITAGIQHLSQLQKMYGGDVAKTLNHYETGDPTNTDHPLKDWCDCPDHQAATGQAGQQGSEANGSGHGASNGHNAAGGHGTSGAQGASGGHNAAAGHGTSGAQGASNGHNAAGGHGTSGAQGASGGHNAAAGHGTSGAQGASGGHNTAGGHGTSGGHNAAGGHGTSGAQEASGGHNATGGHGLTGLGTDQSLGDYITPDSHSASQHIGEGHGIGYLMHKATHDSAMETVFGKPASQVLASIQSGLENSGTYLGGKTDTEKVKGAYLTGNMLMKQAMLPASNFDSEQAAGATYAHAKLEAIAGNVDNLKNIIQSGGGDMLGLSDDQLLNIWATNEHNNLHGVLNAGSPVGQSIHMTSLNDNAMDGTEKGTLGGYNDKGAYPQWGWFKDIQNIASKFPDLQVTQAA